MSRDSETAKLAERVRAGNRVALAQAITLVESRREEHQVLASTLLEMLLPATGGARRIGLSGVPGVGKSTFIETLGSHLIASNRRLAVLAVDPSSPRSGGSILGDKTRMSRLAANPGAFIRPSPSGGSLGGVARRTRESMMLCEAAGFDVVLVETVGTGQSEVAVANLVDCFVLLLLPGAGDELQGIKKGVLELADLFVLNKADGENRGRAEQAAAELRGALRILRAADGGPSPEVLVASGLTGNGIPEVWQAIEAHALELEGGGHLERRRAEQALVWMWTLFDDALASRARRLPAVLSLLTEIDPEVRAGRLSPDAAAERLLAAAGMGRSTPPGPGAPESEEPARD